MKKDPNEKPEMPKEPQTITLPITVTLLNDHSRFCNGSMLLKISDCTVDLTVGKDRKKVGEFGASIGGTIFFCLADDGAEYKLASKDALDFWERLKKEHQRVVAEWKGGQKEKR